MVERSFPALQTFLAVSLMLVTALGQGHAQTETVVYNFGSQSGDGHNPYAGLVRDKKGNLYGTTYGGGAHNYGTVFKLTPKGTETILHSFDYNGADGYYSYSALVLDKEGNLYGTTQMGGAFGYYGYGTVFKVTPSGTETILHSFAQDGVDGGQPFAGVVFDKEGNLYGTTYTGGDYSDGTVFELTPSGTETILHSFGFNSSDGYYPAASLVLDGKGNLYGTTTYGGSNGCNEEGCGTVFEVTPSGTETILHNFDASGDGAYANGNLIRGKKGILYGTTNVGGAYGYGTVFALARVRGKWVETILYSFGNNGTDGNEPASGLVFDKEGNLYGTTVGGGNYGFGTVFELSPPLGGSGSWAEKILWSFGNGTDGAYPEGGLVLDKQGNLYGTTIDGGAYGRGGKGRGYGTVFEVSP